MLLRLRSSARRTGLSVDTSEVTIYSRADAVLPTAKHSPAEAEAEPTEEVRRAFRQDAHKTEGARAQWIGGAREIR